MNYQFRCLECSYEFDRELTLKEYADGALLQECPHCHSINYQRVFSVVPVIFKGDGFTKAVKDESDS